MSSLLLTHTQTAQRCCVNTTMEQQLVELNTAQLASPLRFSGDPKLAFSPFLAHFPTCDLKGIKEEAKQRYIHHCMGMLAIQDTGGLLLIVVPLAVPAGKLPTDSSLPLRKQIHLL